MKENKMTPEEIIEETEANMARLCPKMRDLRNRLSTLEKEFTKSSNTHRKAQASIFPVKKIPLGASSKSKLHLTPLKVIDRMSASEAMKLLHLLKGRISV